MGNCLITRLKETIDNDNLLYLDKAVLFFDSTLGEAPATRNVATNLHLENAGNTIENVDASIFETDIMFINVKRDVTVPTGYTRKMFFNIYDVTKIQTNYGTDASEVLCKYKMRIVDLARCVNLNTLSMINLTFLDTDNPNIEDLTTLTKCSYYNIRGNISPIETIGTWKGDLVKFADGLIANGLNPSQVPVISMVTTGGASGKEQCKFTINGTRIYNGWSYNTWIEFSTGGHYNIYKNVRESDPLDERTTGELIYSK